MFSQADLDLYKKQYPGNPEIQALTLDQVNANAAGVAVDFNSVPPLMEYRKRSILTPCVTSIGTVVFDSVCMALGAVGLRASLKPAAIEAMAEAAMPVVSKLEGIIARMAAKNAGKWDIAAGFFDIISAIYNGGCLGAVLDAFLGALSWWEALTYGIIAVGTIVAILATEGIALIAEIVVLLASAVFLVRDIVHAYETCTQSAPPVTIDNPKAEPEFAFASGAWGGLRTFSKHFVSLVNQGGLFYGTSPMITNRTAVGIWEKFIIVPINQKKGIFALKTLSGFFVTAVEGGGKGGPNDASAPVHTNAQKRQDWEKLRFLKQEDGSYAIQTPKGFYLSANDGGGMNVHAGSQIMYTQIRKFGQWEEFTFVA